MLGLAEQSAMLFVSAALQKEFKDVLGLKKAFLRRVFLNMSCKILLVLGHPGVALIILIAGVGHTRAIGATP